MERILHICLPKACTNSLLLAQDLLLGELWVCVGTVCECWGERSSTSLRTERKKRNWQQYLINCTLCTVNYNHSIYYRATSPFLCALQCRRTFLFPLGQTFCWAWASLGCTCCGDLLIHVLGRDAWFAHWKDKLLILFSVILSQRAKAHLTGLT